MKTSSNKNFFFLALILTAVIGCIYWLKKHDEILKLSEEASKPQAVKTELASKGWENIIQSPRALNAAQKISDSAPKNTSKKNSNAIDTSPAVTIPFGAPLAASINALREASKKGDTLAACRVQLELTMCDSYSTYSLSQLKIRAQKDPKFAKFASVREALCTGVNEADVKNSGNWRANFDTAMQGSESHMQNFSMIGPIVDPASNEMVAAAAAWKEFAPTLIKAAADKGMPRALFTLAMEYNGDLLTSPRYFQPQTAIFLPNEEFALFYAYAAIQYFRETSKFDPKWEERVEPIVREKVETQIATATLKMPQAQIALIKQKADEYIASIIASRPEYSDRIKLALENFPEYKMCFR